MGKEGTDVMPRMLYGVLILLCLIWGGSFFFIKQLLPDFGPMSIVFLRSSFGLVTITASMVIMRQPFSLKKIRWMPMAVMALVNTAIPWGIISFAETRLTSSMASIMNATTPLWTIIVGAAVFRAATHRMQWIGMGIAFVGLIVLLDFNPHSIITVDGLGFLCMLAATLCYAVGSHLSKRLQGVTMYQITFGTLLTSTMAGGVAALTLEPFSLHHLAVPSNFAMLTGLGVFGSGFAYMLYYFLVQKGSPEFASMVTYLVPATAVIWGSTLLNEPLHWSMLAGLMFILTGVFIASRKLNRASRKTAPLLPSDRAVET